MDLALTVESKSIYERALLRVFCVGPGELSVAPFPRRILMRTADRVISGLHGTFTATMPSDWEIPIGQVTPFLVMLHAAKHKTIYCRSFGRPVLNHRSASGDKLQISFESAGLIFTVPPHLNPDKVAEFELGLLEGGENVIFALVSYADWLYENSKGWRRLELIRRELKRIAAKPVELTETGEN